MTCWPLITERLVPVKCLHAAPLTLACNLFLTLSFAPPAFAVEAVPSPPPPPGYSADVYFHHEGPISGPPAPRLTTRDYRSLPLPYPLSESRVVVWVLAQQHLYFGAFVLGSLWWVLLAEATSLATRDAECAQRYRAAGYEMLRLVVTSVTIAALFGGFLLVGLFGLYPGLTRYLAGVFRTTALFNGVLFVTFSVTTVLYFYTWPRDAAARGTWDHLGLGVFVNLLGTAIMLIANSWGSFMMSPAGVDPSGRFLGSDLHVFLNPLSIPMAVHRFAGNLVFAGAVIATYAAYRALATEARERRAYYDWMGGLALVATIGAFITIPFIGYWVHRSIYAYRQGMGIALLSGLFAWLSTILVLLVGVLIIAMTYYLWLRIGAESGGRRFRYQAKYVLMILGLGLLVYVTPRTLMMRKAELEAIGGLQHPVIGRFGLEGAKQAAINIMSAAMIWTLLTWWRSKYEESRPWLSIALVALFVAGSINLLWISIIGSFIPANVRVGLQVPAVMTTFSLLLIGAGITRILVAGSTRAPSSGWGALSPHGYWALLFIGVTVTWIMGLAGHERSGIRMFWHTMEIVRDNSPWAFTHTAGFVGDVVTVNTLFFWLAMLAVAWLANRGQPTLNA